MHALQSQKPQRQRVRLPPPAGCRRVVGDDGLRAGEAHVNTAAPLKDLDRHVLLVANAPNASKARAIRLDVTRAVEGACDELVPRLRSGLCSRKVVLGYAASGKAAWVVNVHSIPENVNLNGGGVLVAAMTEGVVERLANRAQGNLGALLAVKGRTVDDALTARVVQDVRLGSLDHAEQRARLLMVVEYLRAVGVPQHAHAQHGVERGAEAYGW